MSYPITLGIDVKTGQPVTVDREFLARGHTHIRGQSGAGKTTRALLPLILQLMAAPPDADQDRPDPIFIFDLGGDNSLFHCVRAAAESLGRTFRFLSLEHDEDWHFFDPFQAVNPGKSRIIHLASMLIEAFNLDNGQIYGGQYFTQQNLAALLEVARHLIQQQAADAPVSIDQISTYLERNRKRVRDSEQIRTMFAFLENYDQLRPHLASSPDQLIDVARAIDAGEVIYFHLPTLGEAITARPIAGLALFTIQQIAQQRPRNNKSKRQAWVFIDEFHEIAGRSFGRFLVQCRRFGLSLFLSHQDNNQLHDRDTALDRIVFTNTRTKMYFSITGQEETEELQSLSRTARVLLNVNGTSWSTAKGKGTATGQSFTTSYHNSNTDSRTRTETTQTSTGGSRGTKEEIRPELEVNDILAVDGTEGQFFLTVKSGRGHTQPLPVQGLHVVNPQAHGAAFDKPLPLRTTPLAQGNSTPKRPSDSSLAQPPEPGSAPGPSDRRQQQLAALRERVRERLMCDALGLPRKDNRPRRV
jgi:hypothetical protein